MLSAASVKGGFAIDLPLTGTPGIEDRRSSGALTNKPSSIILGVLGSGGYTAIVKGADGGAGIGRVEAYNLQ